MSQENKIKNNNLNPDVKSILKLSLPMVLVALSNNLMSSFDKMILAQLDINLMSMALMAHHVVLIPFFGILSLTGISEVFIGQFNGAGDYKKVCWPMWQMIFFSSLLFVISIPVGLWGGQYILPQNVYEVAHEYFSILIIFVPLAGFIGAFSAFYVGIGKTKHVITCVVIGNLIGVSIDYILVIGINDFYGITIESIGIKGAAIGTVCGQIIITIMLVGGLFRNKFRTIYNTLNIYFDYKMLIDQLKVGFPNSVSHSGEMLAWTLMLNLITIMKPEILPEVTIPCALFGFLVFATDGFQKGIIAVSSNIIGGKYFDKFKELDKSVIKISLILMVVIVIPLFCFPEYITRLYGVDKPSEGLIDAIHMVAFYLMLDIPMWLLAGLLTSGGDTKYIMKVNLFSSWLLCVLPIYLILKMGLLTKGAFIWFVFMGYVVFNFSAYLIRYNKGKWRQDIMVPTT